MHPSDSLMQRQYNSPAFFACIVAMIAIGGCGTPSLDMSGGRIEPPGPDGGLVIGAILVQAEQEPPNSWFNRLFGRNAAGFVYDFEIVQVDTNVSNRKHPYKVRYELDAKPGEEWIFVARLPAGDYLFKGFRHEGLSVMGGELGLSFSVAPDTTRYIGRLLLEEPRRMTKGIPFTFTVQDTRDATLAVVSKEHLDIGQQAVNFPMQAR